VIQGKTVKFFNASSVSRTLVSKTLVALAALALLAGGAFAQGGSSYSTPMAEHDPDAKIVNGVLTWTFPTTVALVDNLGTLCSGTLIGCETVLAAAHCFCQGDTAGTCGTPNISGLQVFTQHAGIRDIQSVSIDPTYSFGVTGDLAVLKLTQPVTGISPTPINRVGKPANGSVAAIAGFGLSGEGGLDSGLKRAGLVTTAGCQIVPPAGHVCWNFNNPLGDPGDDSNTCSGDSGGPLFVNFGAGDVVAGVTSGGISQDCNPPDESFDANVFPRRNWIQSQGGSDLNNTSCGNLPSAGGPDTEILFGSGNLSVSNPDDRFFFEVPVGTTRLRVALNGEDGFGSDFDLFVKRGSQPTTNDFDCSSERVGMYEECEFFSPVAGTWHVLVDRFAGSGEFQLTVTLFEGDDGTGGPCEPSDTVLCIDDEPGDERFKVTLEYDTVLGGGLMGDATVEPLAVLGIRKGGVFSFTDPTNPEVLVKVLDGCSITNHYWVFFAATTTVGFELTVEDTLSGDVKVYTNPDLQAALPVTDTEAFATCP